MIRFLVAILAAAVVSAAYSQPVPNPGMNELKEKVIPWEKALPPIGNATGKSGVIEGRTYSAYQLGLISLFEGWIKKSYIPIGGLPQPERYALPESRENKLYLPQGTGMGMGLWVPCYDPTGKKIIKAQPASRSYIVIATNHLKGLEPAHDLNTPSQYYFTMYYDQKGKLVKEEDEVKNAPYVNEIRSKIGDYFIYFTGNLVNILLMPGKELPVAPVSKKEMLEECEKAVRRIYPEPDNFLRKEVETQIRQLRDKYSTRLEEPALIYRSQLTATVFTGGTDPFVPLINDPKQLFPLYRFKPEMYALAKQDKPQWVHISFPYANEKSSTVEWEIFKAMTTHFNYQYVYDYFFNPEKVKGVAYQPRQPVTLADALARIDARENKAHTSKTFPEGVHFMEDFADAQSGQMPAGWTSRQNNRGFVIETPAGENGKWLYLDSGADLLPSSLKTPLPPAFTLEFDLLCSDFTNRSGRTVTVKLSGPNVSASLNITPGNEQNIKIYPSMANFRVSAGGGSQGYHSMEFASFSNKKTKAHVKIVKSGSAIIAYINGTKVESDPKYRQDYEKEMSLGNNTTFTKLEWTSDIVSQNPPIDAGKVYISNIKISRQ